MTDDKRFGELELKVALLDKDVSVLGDLCSRLTDSIDKIQSMNQNVISLIALQGQKLESHEKTEREMKEEMKELHLRMENINRDMQDKIGHKHLSELSAVAAVDNSDEIDKRISDIERWRWMIMGAIAIAAWIVGQADFIGKFFK